MVAVRRAPSSAPVSKFAGLLTCVRLPPCRSELARDSDDDPIASKLAPTRVDTATYAISDSVNLEAALAQASDLLRCAGASASEAGNGLSGQPRDLMMSVMHLVELAKAFVDKSLDGLAMH